MRGERPAPVRGQSSAGARLERPPGRASRAARPSRRRSRMWKPRPRCVSTAALGAEAAALLELARRSGAGRATSDAEARVAEPVVVGVEAHRVAVSSPTGWGWPRARPRRSGWRPRDGLAAGGRARARLGRGARLRARAGRALRLGRRDPLAVVGDPLAVAQVEVVDLLRVELSRYSTRFQTRAAYLVGICSNRATTGPTTPGGISQIALAGKPVVERLELLRATRRRRRPCRTSTGARGRRARGCGSSRWGRCCRRGRRPAARAGRSRRLVDVLAGGGRADRVGDLVAGGRRGCCPWSGWTWPSSPSTGRLDRVDRRARVGGRRTPT